MQNSGKLDFGTPCIFLQLKFLLGITKLNNFGNGLLIFQDSLLYFQDNLFPRYSALFSKHYFIFEIFCLVFIYLFRVRQWIVVKSPVS